MIFNWLYTFKFSVAIDYRAKIFIFCMGQLLMSNSIFISLETLATTSWAKNIMIRRMLYYLMSDKLLLRGKRLGATTNKIMDSKMNVFNMTWESKFIWKRLETGITFVFILQLFELLIVWFHYKWIFTLFFETYNLIIFYLFCWKARFRE